MLSILKDFWRELPSIIDEYCRDFRSILIAVLLALAVIVAIILANVEIARGDPSPIEKRIEKLQPQFAKKIITLINEIEQQYPEYEIVIAETLRSEDRQRYLKMQGFSWTLNSKHLTGNAVDIYFVRGSRILDYKEAPYHFIGTLCKQLGLVWGGDWKVRDYGHIEEKSIY